MAMAHQFHLFKSKAPAYEQESVLSDIFGVIGDGERIKCEKAAAAGLIMN